MSSKKVVVDGRGHLMGRLASIVAKRILMGENIIVVRCEEIMISGTLLRNKIRFANFRKKRMNTNPKKGPFHYRSPSEHLWKTVRGMIPHKTNRGKMAMRRFKPFDGIPEKYHKKKRMVIPQALKIIKLSPGRKFCVLGRLSTEVGWKQAKVVERLESERKIKSSAFYKKKKVLLEKRRKAAKAVEAKKSKPKAIKVAKKAADTKVAEKAAGPKVKKAAAAAKK
eukprot:CAMPEP_0171461748 /NCGR_PEP_ID=MMETSP0945-20130129/6068_1 /TAXON_ID=109269 /ORGANISM="Vaucheria litorea, Strain CCMP2940" /LENGTH=223 /DNA_ID=CAMNT_0011988149 /DNA_START=67 /DNA_END=738 /DNA_ORIENTATION=-